MYDSDTNKYNNALTTDLKDKYRNINTNERKQKCLNWRKQNNLSISKNSCEKNDLIYDPSIGKGRNKKRKGGYYDPLAAFNYWVNHDVLKISNY